MIIKTKKKKKTDEACRVAGEVGIFLNGMMSIEDLRRWNFRKDPIEVR